MRSVTIAQHQLFDVFLSIENRRLERSQLMSLQGRSSEQVQTGENAGGKGRFSFIGAGISTSNPRVQYLLESAPQRSTVLLVILGMVVGMLTAYVIIPTEFTGAAPRHMSEQAIQQWVRMVAVGHSQAIHYDGGNALLVLQQIPDPQGTVENLANNTQIPAAERAALEALMDIAGFEDLNGALAPQDPGVLSSALQVIVALAAVAIAIPAVTISARAIYPSRASGRTAQRSEARKAGAQQSQVFPVGTQPSQTYSAYSESPPQAAMIEDETERSGTLHPQHGVPVLHKVSTYVKGRNYDDSFAIELGPEQGNQFLGECGISIATRVGNELQSVEFWGFDMASQETLTKVFAAPAALGDPALHAAVANRVQDPMNDIVAAEHGARLILESNSILIQAEIKTVICNYGGGIPNSGIENLQIEILAWHRQTQPMTVPTSNYPTPVDSPFAEYADVHFTPPTRNASPVPPPAVGSSAPRPSSGPQPGKRPEDEDEDPFGGTGNFMPYS